MNPDALQTLHADLERNKAAIRAVKQIAKILAKLPDDESRAKVVAALKGN